MHKVSFLVTILCTLLYQSATHALTITGEPRTFVKPSKISFNRWSNNESYKLQANAGNAQEKIAHYKQSIAQAHSKLQTALKNDDVETAYDALEEINRSSYMFMVLLAYAKDSKIQCH